MVKIMSEGEKKLSKSARRRRNKRRRMHELEHANGHNYTLKNAFPDNPPNNRNSGIDTLEDCAEALINKLVKERHKPVLKAICASLGVSKADYIGSVLTAAITSHLPAYREAQGMGGASSKNIQMLEDKLPVRK